MSFNKCHQDDGTSDPLFTADQMRAYALASRPADTGERGVVVALRNIAEGNLGDGPGQANYARIRETAAAALRAQPADGGEDDVLAERAALLNAGGPLANIAFNLAQSPRLTVAERDSLDKCRKAWDAACLALTERHAPIQQHPMEGGGHAEPPSDEVWPPDGAVWLAPVATDAPANPKLMQYAWGRSSLSSGQMAEAYQCIVSAAQECGQVYRLPVATPPESGGQGEKGRWFCDGPNGYFYSDDADAARKALNIIDPDGDDWTMTDTLNPFGADSITQGGGNGR